MGIKEVSKLVFYAQSTSAVISGRMGIKTNKKYCLPKHFALKMITKCFALPLETKSLF